MPRPLHWGIDPEPFVPGHNPANRELDTLFARNDRGEYDAPAPSVRRANDDPNDLHSILHCHLEDPWQTQREITLEAYCDEHSPDEIAQRRGIRLNTHHNHRKAAFSGRRDAMMVVVDCSTDSDLPD